MKLLTDTVEHFLENAVDYLTEIFSAITEEKVCACVKVIVGAGGGEDILYCVVRILGGKANDFSAFGYN